MARTRSTRTLLVTGFALLVSWSALSCRKPTPPDPLCVEEPVVDTSQVPPGQGALLIAATGQSYFYVLDEAGKQLGHQTANKSIALKPGTYQVKVNSSVHRATVREKNLTRCSAGAVLVSGSTDDYYYVLDMSGTQLTHERTGRSIDLFPGKYQLKLNNSIAAVEVQPGAPVEVKAGTLKGEGTTGDYYYLLDPAGTQLSHNTLGKPLGAFAGAYSIKLNGSAMKVDLRAGETTTAQTGTVVVAGTTGEYYYVLDPAGTQLSHNTLGKPLALCPGSYTAKVNNTSAPAAVTAGNLTQVETGTLLVEGSTGEYYYVLDAAGTQLSHNTLGKSLCLMPGTYTGRVNNATFAVELKAGETSVYKTGTVTVKGAGSDYYYVLDAAGTQLAHNRLNQPSALPPGKYSVKVGESVRPVAVTAGADAVLGR